MNKQRKFGNMNKQRKLKIRAYEQTKKIEN